MKCQIYLKESFSILLAVNCLMIVFYYLMLKKDFFCFFGRIIEQSQVIIFLNLFK